MNNQELRSTFSLSLIFAFRMLGLFMILPIFANFSEKLPDATPSLIGLALGIYGLTQAMLQIPFGLLSDKFGRKLIILIGLCIFAIGSVIAAHSNTIYGIILGRAIQGAGAVGSVIIALVADLTSEKNRTKAMAMIGMTIGFAFVFSMIVGPILAGTIGIPGIFWLTAILALVGILVLYASVPTPATLTIHSDAETIPHLFKSILSNKDLLRLDFGILVLHAILTATFIVVPLSLEQFTDLSITHQWFLYLPVLLFAFFAMLPMIIIAEKKQKMRTMFLFGISLIAIAEFGLWLFHHNIWMMAFLLFVFFTAFTFLEASLPSLISKQAPAECKGTAMGIYSTSQFLGIFFGGIFGGWILGHFGKNEIFFCSGLLCLIWLAVAYTMREPQTLKIHSAPSLI